MRRKWSSSKHRPQRIFVSQIRLALISTMALSILLATGCNYKQVLQNSDYDYGSRQANDPKMIGSRMYGSLTGNPDQHNNAYFEYSNMLSREVSSINGVFTGVVMVTDKNSYVAIIVDNTAVGTYGRGGADMKMQDNSGANDGIYNNLNGSPYYNNQKLSTPYNSYFTINDHNLISTELKQRVAAKVRYYMPDVEEVHISASMDFVNEMVDYAKEAWMNRPLSPWTEHFNTLVKYEFAGGTQMPVSLKELKARRTAPQQR
ncbi:hypothetical protein EBB07_06875 [Paenibacillaceae bacterium]|nr:hypothetical protein EBB07_06875 [Paenibacillaceae bacterium]